MFGQNVTEHNPAPSPSGHPLLSGPPPTLKTRFTRPYKRYYTRCIHRARGTRGLALARAVSRIIPRKLGLGWGRVSSRFRLGSISPCLRAALSLDRPCLSVCARAARTHARTRRTRRTHVGSVLVCSALITSWAKCAPPPPPRRPRCLKPARDSARWIPPPRRAVSIYSYLSSRARDAAASATSRGGQGGPTACRHSAEQHANAAS